MTFSVLVEPCEGRFAATLAGAPEVRVVAPTRNEAIAALRTEIAQRVAHGELCSLEIGAGGVAELAGKYAADATIREICADAYECRNAEARE
jgi:hypothetical protein